VRPPREYRTDAPHKEKTDASTANREYTYTYEQSPSPG